MRQAFGLSLRELGKTELLKQKTQLNQENLTLSGQYETLAQQSYNIAAQASKATDPTKQESLNAQYAEKVKEMNGVMKKIETNDASIRGIEQSVEQIDNVLNSNN